MADFNVIEILGTVNSVASYKEDGTAAFILLYRGGVKPVNYVIATNLRYLIDKTIKPFIIRENIGKRVMIVGSIIDTNIIAPNRIHFIDAFVSAEQAAKIKNEEVDFSDD